MAGQAVISLPWFDRHWCCPAHCDHSPRIPLPLACSQQSPAWAHSHPNRRRCRLVQAALQHATHAAEEPHSAHPRPPEGKFKETLPATACPFLPADALTSQPPFPGSREGTPPCCCPPPSQVHQNRPGECEAAVTSHAALEFRLLHALARVLLPQPC